MVWDIRPFNSGLFVGVRAWLFADQPQFVHKAPNLEAANSDAFVAEHVLNRPAASRAAALGEQAVYLSLQGQTLNVNVAPPVAVLVIVGTTDIKRFTDQFRRLLLPQSVYQRVRFISSDIKRVVNMSYSRSADYSVLPALGYGVAPGLGPCPSG